MSTTMSKMLDERIYPALPDAEGHLFNMTVECRFRG